jgi:Pyruvate ferredoxin/flavodoxin oxidoreductase
VNQAVGSRRRRVQVRSHGRGGQGVVTAAELLSVPPSRRAATRRPPRASAPSALRPDGHVLVNSARTLEELGILGVAVRLHPQRIATVPATELALEHLGRPVPDAVLLGAFAAATSMVSIAAVIDAVRQKFSGQVADGNVAAAEAAYTLVLPDLGGTGDAQAGRGLAGRRGGRLRGSPPGVSTPGGDPTGLVVARRGGPRQSSNPDRARSTRSARSSSVASCSSPKPSSRVSSVDVPA